MMVKSTGRERILMEEFWDMSWCFRKHASFCISVFRGHVQTHILHLQQHLPCFSLAPQIYGIAFLGESCPHVIQKDLLPCSRPKSPGKVSYNSPISRDPQHCLEHLVTSDRQMSTVPGSWTVGLVAWCLWGSEHILGCHRPDLGAAPCSSLTSSSGGSLHRLLGLQTIPVFA